MSMKRGHLRILRYRIKKFKKVIATLWTLKKQDVSCWNSRWSWSCQECQELIKNSINIITHNRGIQISGKKKKSKVHQSVLINLVYLRIIISSIFKGVKGGNKILRDTREKKQIIHRRVPVGWNTDFSWKIL